MLNRIVYLPENLDLQELLKTNPPSFKYKIDHFKYILGLLTSIPSYNKDMLDNNAGMVRIEAHTLQSHVRHYNDYIAYLINNGVIYTDNHFILGGKSRCYQFTEKYVGPVKKDSIELYSLIKSFWNNELKVEKSKRKYKDLSRWFNSNLWIDKDAALDYLKSEYHYNMAEANIIKNKKKRIDARINAQNKYNASYVAIENLANGLFNFSVDTNVGRSHTNLTNIKKEIRNFVYYKDGNCKLDLVSVDLKNSQPLFSALLLNPAFLKPKDAEKNKDEVKLINIHQILKKYPHYNKIINPSLLNTITLAVSSKSVAAQGFSEYTNLVESGHLYECFFKALSVVLDQKSILRFDFPDNHRKKTKNEIFTALYSENELFTLSKKVFNDYFPAPDKVFRIYKRIHHSLLPRLLQIIESIVFIETASVRLSNELKNVPLYTIHDSIVCPVGYEETVGKVLTETIIQMTGMNPTLDYEYWNPEKAIKREFPIAV